MNKTKYAGPVGPAEAMSALDEKFLAAYQTATEAIMAATLQFETATGRVVDHIDLSAIDITTFADTQKRQRRHVSINFLPRPGEVEW